MTVKELKEQINNLNDDVIVCIGKNFQFTEEITIKKFSNKGRDSSDKDCITISLEGFNFKDITGVESYGKNIT